MLKSITSRLNKLGKLPTGATKDTVLVTSYPKSGNTWMRFMLANLMTPETEINFHNVHDIIPPDSAPEAGSTFHGWTFLKSHSAYTPQYPKVIYLVRHPLDAYVSYYRMLEKEKSLGSKVDFVLGGEHLAYGRWSEHVNSWLNTPKDGKACPEVMLLRYEDMVANPIVSLQQIVGFLGMSVSTSEVSAAAHKSSFESMRAVEDKYGRRMGSADIKFVRRGQPGGWQNELTPAAADTILAGESSDLLAHLGYSSTGTYSAS